MKQIKRYDWVEDGMSLHSEGDFVFNSDHAAIVDSMGAALVKLDGACLEAERELARLHAEVEVLRVDAERWRHARMLFCIDDIDGRSEDLHSFGYIVSEEENKKADEAVDRAIAAMKEEAE